MCIKNMLRKTDLCIVNYFDNIQTVIKCLNTAELYRIILLYYILFFETIFLSLWSMVFERYLKFCYLPLFRHTYLASLTL